MFNFIDLFAGCGGLSEGFLQTKKFIGIAHVEWELPMVETLRNRLTTKWEHSALEAMQRVIHFDIQKIEELIDGNWSNESTDLYCDTNDDLVVHKGLNSIVNNNTIDVIIGGPPCQAYSIHGRATDKDSMINDYRNYLFESFVKVVNHFKPRVFVFENVPGILSAKPGGVHITKRIHKAFDEIGYKILAPQKLSKAVFDTSDFLVPQNRKRVIIIGIAKDSDLNIDEIYLKLKQKGSTSKITVFDAINDLPHFYPLKKSKRINGRNVSHVSDNNSVLNHIARYHNERDTDIFKEWVEKSMNTLSHQKKIEYYYAKTGRNTLYSKYKSLEWNKQAHTIVAHLEKDGLMFIHPDANQARSITAREAARLMTFPDDYEFIGSNAKCYKMIGNAVPVNFAKTLAETLAEFL